jgi:hypothetical protein
MANGDYYGNVPAGSGIPAPAATTDGGGTAAGPAAAPAASQPASLSDGFFGWLKGDAANQQEFARRWQNGDSAFLGMPRVPATGNAADDLDRRLAEQARLQAQGMPTSPLTAGSLRLYGSNGNSTAAEALLEAKDTVVIGGANTALDVMPKVLGMVPGPVGWGAAAVGASVDLADGNYRGLAMQGAIFLGSQAVPWALGRLGRARLGSCGLRETCFAADTPLRTPMGARRIEDFRPGDWLLSRDESRPHGEVEAKQVEEVFTARARLLELRVGGQVIRTTANHPFWLDGRGWTAAADLRAGDRLLSPDGRLVAVAGVRDSGEEAAVYNLRVAEYHTYFVGGLDWGFAVWAHNSCYAETFFKANPSLRGRVWVHHAIPQAVLKRYPGLFTHAELDALSNLRGIPKAINRDLHLSTINRTWNNFYRDYPNATRDMIEQYANLLDRWLGHNFLPPV